MTTPTILISSPKSFAAVYRPHMTAKYHTPRSMLEKILTSNMLNRSLCPLHPKHRRQSHSIKHIHTSIFVLPQTAFGRQFASKFNRIFSGEQFCHFVLCSFDIAEPCVTQLVS